MPRRQNWRRRALPELLASWLIRIEEDWRTHVLEN